MTGEIQFVTYLLVIFRVDDKKYKNSDTLRSSVIKILCRELKFWIKKCVLNFDKFSYVQISSVFVNFKLIVRLSYGIRIRHNFTSDFVAHLLIHIKALCHEVLLRDRWKLNFSLRTPGNCADFDMILNDFNSSINLDDFWFRRLIQKICTGKILWW